MKLSPIDNTNGFSNLSNAPVSSLGSNSLSLNN